MTILRTGGSKEPATSSTDEELLRAHHAIEAARAGTLPVQEMVKVLMSGPIEVPLVEPPRMERQEMKGWKPATLSKADGSQWLVAFTSSDLTTAFSKQNPAYCHGIRVDAAWVLRVMPAAHGLVFNLGSEAMFEWNAAGLERYKDEVLGMTAS